MFLKTRKRMVIIGAAGRDFDNFNVVFRHDFSVEVMAFTAAQIPDIAGRKYPASLAGSLYPNGIPIIDEAELDDFIRKNDIDECIMSYSDLSYGQVMRIAARVNAAGSRFTMLGAKETMLASRKPVIAVVATRTGCGKSQTTRRVVEILQESGLKVVSIRHPMPYGDLEKQAVQRFATLQDLVDHECTIEEVEEYEPHLAIGSIIFSGVDYERIIRQAEMEADVIIWDGGNNDTSFYKPDYTFVVVDPFRPGHEIGYYPGEINLRMANCVIINKCNSAPAEGVAEVERNVRAVNPGAKVILAASELTVDDPSILKGKRVLVIEDGPTLTHGGMKIGAGTEAVRMAGAAELVDPRPYAVGRIAETFRKYPDIGILLPAMGYGDQQVRDLEATIAATPCEAVVIGTPIDLARFVKINQPHTRVRYELDEISKEKMRHLLQLKGII